MKKTLPVLLILMASASAFGAPQACRKAIEERLCYTSDTEHWLAYVGPYKSNALKAFQNRSCSPVPSYRRSELLEVYDALPAQVKQAFCHVQKVFLVRDAEDYGARASYSYDDSTIRFKTTGRSVNFQGKSNGFILEISEPARFKKESGEEFKARVSYARFLDKASIAKELTFEWEIPSIKNSSQALATTIVHEVGHFLSRASGLYLKMSEGKATEWSNFSWSNGTGSFAPRREADFLTWYSIQSKSISKHEIKSVTEFLLRTGEASLYSLDNPDESFAEHFMYHFYPAFRMLHDGRVVLDVEKEYAKPSSALRRKRAYIEGLLKRKQDPFVQDNFMHSRTYETLF